jgi:hypothetical protein
MLGNNFYLKECNCISNNNMSLKELESLVTTMEKEDNLQTKLQLYTAIQDKYKGVDQLNRKLISQINEYKPRKKRGDVQSLDNLECQLDNIEKMVDEEVELSDFFRDYKKIVDNIFQFRKQVQDIGLSIQQVSEHEDQFQLEEFKI